MLDYGDSKDRLSQYQPLSSILNLSSFSYYMQLDRYGSELNYARQYAGQKAWPRAVFVRRARLVLTFNAVFYYLIRSIW